MPNLPPLTALRAFEAAARHMSFAKAAAELSVTPAALSFQIKSLETHLGEPVFLRLNRAVELTKAGRDLQPLVAQGFSILTEAWAGARRRQNQSVLTVTAGPGFTAKWLAPRIYDFAQAHPEIELRLVAAMNLLDFERDDVDVAIRFGTRTDEQLFSAPFPQEWATPVITSALAAQITAPEDLRNHVLIHDDSTLFLSGALGWSRWFEAAGLGAPPHGGPRFSGTDHALDMALEGRGATMGRISITERLLRGGQLVAPFPLAMRNTARYRFLCRKGEETRPAICSFRKWVFAALTPLHALEEGRVFVDT
jgi:LysR family glycine cleavage system transcriptional activator